MTLQRHILPQAAPVRVFRGAGAAYITRPGLTAEYECLPAFEGEGATRPNRIGVIFSGHASVALKQDGMFYDVRACPGSLYVVGTNAPTLLRVREYSDILKIYPDMAVLAAVANEAGVAGFELEPSLRGSRSIAFASDPVILGAAHVLRMACLDRTALADIEAEEIAHLIAARVMLIQYGHRPRFGPAATLTERRLRALSEFIEAHLTGTVSLEALADLVGISPFHFARCFRKTTGLAPHQFVTARRFDLARRLLINTRSSVQDIALSVGYENLSHFRRQFVAQFGITPVEMRKSICARAAE